MGLIVAAVISAFVMVHDFSTTCIVDGKFNNACQHVEKRFAPPTFYEGN